MLCSVRLISLKCNRLNGLASINPELTFQSQQDMERQIKRRVRRRKQIDKCLKEIEALAKWARMFTVLEDRNRMIEEKNDELTNIVGLFDDKWNPPQLIKVKSPVVLIPKKENLDLKVNETIDIKPKDFLKELPFIKIEHSDEDKIRRIRKKHRKMMKKEQQKDKKFLCRHPTCGKTFTLKQNLKVHKRTAHTDYRPFRCPLPGCNKSYKTRYSLELHQSTHQKLSPDGNLFKCHCGRQFKHPHFLQTHQKQMHVDSSMLTCKICNKKLSCPRNLKNHERLHTGNRPFSCYECNKTFISAGELNRHLSRHLLPKRFKCRLAGCGKAYDYKKLFEIHVKQFGHTTEFECRKCDLMFMDETRLKEHLCEKEN